MFVLLLGKNQSWGEDILIGILVLNTEFGTCSICFRDSVLIRLPEMRGVSKMIDFWQVVS